MRMRHHLLVKGWPQSWQQLCDRTVTVRRVRSIAGDVPTLFNNCVTARGGVQGAERHRTVIPGDTPMSFPRTKAPPFKSFFLKMSDFAFLNLCTLTLLFLANSVEGVLRIGERESL